MKPAAFDYVRAESVDEVVDLLARHGDDARVLAGGQSLMAVLNMRFSQPGVVIDINRVAGLDRIETRGGMLCVGAAVRQVALERHPGLTEQVPLLALAVGHIGHVQTRNRGTVCGSIAHADPSAELPLVLVALGGEVVLRSRRGTRTLAAADFFLGPLTTARTAEEFITEVRFPIAPPVDRHAFREIAMRHGDFAIVALAAVASGGETRLAVGGVGDRPVLRTVPGGASRAAALNALAWELGGSDDVHASAAYRRQLVRELGARLLDEVTA